MTDATASMRAFVDEAWQRFETATVPDWVIAHLMAIDPTRWHGHAVCDDCEGTGVGLRLASGETWPCRTCDGIGYRPQFVPDGKS